MLFIFIIIIFTVQVKPRGAASYNLVRYTFTYSFGQNTSCGFYYGYFSIRRLQRRNARSKRLAELPPLRQPGARGSCSQGAPCV